jgi:hypothetical protein
MLYLRNDEAMSGLIFPIGTAPPARKIAQHTVVLRTIASRPSKDRAALAAGFCCIITVPAPSNRAVARAERLSKTAVT